MRGNRGPSRELPEDGTRQLDLVLLHHSLQFAPSRWKEIRGRLGPGRPQTVTLPGPGPTDEAAIDHEARHCQENRDLFHQHLHAETLFMTGSAKVFRDTARHFFDVARNGPGKSSRSPSHRTHIPSTRATPFRAKAFVQLLRDECLAGGDAGSVGAQQSRPGVLCPTRTRWRELRPHAPRRGSLGLRGRASNLMACHAPVCVWAAQRVGVCGYWERR